LDRKHGSVNFRLTQALTGVFNYFLHKINKTETNTCRHCDGRNNIDTVQHTLQECAAWATEREEFARQSGMVNTGEITLGNIIRKMLESKEKWQTANRYINEIIIKKEEEERLRQRDEERNARNEDRDR